MLEDLITAAFNDAVNKANEEASRRTSAATAGMSLPAGMKLPF
jgi:DNA-binding protein YbaB